MGKINKLVSKFNGLLAKTGDISPLIARLTIGWVFLWAGYDKLGDLDRVIGFFDALGIPFASIQAPFIAALELIGGLALTVGFGTRVFSFLLAATMVVALMTAHKEDITVFTDAFKLFQFGYILVFAFLMSHGAGKLSVDQLLKKKG